MFPLEVRGEVCNHKDTRIGGYPPTIQHDRSLSHFDAVLACDGQMDRLTYGFSIGLASTALCIASCGGAL